MNEDMSKLIGSMLQNPDAVKNLMGAFGSFANGGFANGSSNGGSNNGSNGGSSSSSSADSDSGTGYTSETGSALMQPDLESSVKSMMNVLNQSDDRRITLLNALKPYLSPARAGGIDRAIRILKLTKLSEVLRNERE